MASHDNLVLVQIYRFSLIYSTKKWLECLDAMDTCCSVLLQKENQDTVVCTVCGTRWYNYRGQWLAINRTSEKTFQGTRRAAGRKPIHMPHLCKVCQRCMIHCPKNAIRLREGALHIDKYRCNNCRKCVNQCSENALK
ncbi:MAG: 4Fe-4S dicluster domain-containing protein [Bacteroidales bacterium]